ncbi:hypothetical protein ACFL4L_03630 [bacterium]
MLLKNKQPLVIIGFGQLSLALGVLGILLLKPFTGQHPLTSLYGFACGLSLGISIVFNTVGLIRIRKQRVS